MRGVLILLSALLLTMVTAHAREMRLTIYDDGISCPSNCDAHFVMNSADNGTRHAYRPDTGPSAPKPCKNGEECTICFGETSNSCMRAIYRGGGPKTGTFDFTPAFYAANCSRDDVPDALKRQCQSLDRAAANHGYTTAVNCFNSPDDPKCSAVISAAKVAQQADIPKRAECLRMGEAAFNKAQTNLEERRTNACNYSLLLLGGSGARHWHKLLPAACREGTYVDQFGLDCCSADIRFAANNHPECKAFFLH
jgi:hypothetical protein